MVPRFNAPCTDIISDGSALQWVELHYLSWGKVNQPFDYSTTRPYCNSTFRRIGWTNHHLTDQQFDDSTTPFDSGQFDRMPPFEYSAIQRVDQTTIRLIKDSTIWPFTAIRLLNDSTNQQKCISTIRRFDESVTKPSFDSSTFRRLDHITIRLVDYSTISP